MPTRKVTGGALAGACTVLLVWALKQYGGTEVPGEAGAAITTILTFIVSYLIPEPA